MNQEKIEFYYLRHGLVDYGKNDGLDETPDAPLNAKGQEQARVVRPVIERLPIRTICVSPLLRAQQTKNIVAENLNVPVVVIEELRECDDTIWFAMNALDSSSPPAMVEQAVFDFMDRAVEGILKAITHPGPVLIVAHGGIHWAFCHQLNVEHPMKRLLHCVPVHFTCHNNSWKAKLV